MVHEEKNRKTKLPPLGIIINFGLRCAGLVVVIGLLYACGKTFSPVLGIYLGYKVLRLVMRLFGLLFSLLITVLFILILILIISFIIF